MNTVDQMREILKHLPGSAPVYCYQHTAAGDTIVQIVRMCFARSEV